MSYLPLSADVTTFKSGWIESGDSHHKSAVGDVPMRQVCYLSGGLCPAADRDGTIFAFTKAAYLPMTQDCFSSARTAILM